MPRRSVRLSMLAVALSLALAAPAGATTARLTPAAAPAGTRVVVEGGGVPPGGGVVVLLAGRAVTFVLAGGDGSYVAPVAIPPGLGPGVRRLDVLAVTDRLRMALRVTPGPAGGAPASLASTDGVRLTAVPSVAPPGTQFVLRASGLPARKFVTVTLTGAPRARLRASRGGRLRATLRMPSSRAGRELATVRYDGGALTLPVYAMPPDTVAPPLPPPGRDPPLLAAAGDIACDPGSRRTRDFCHQSDTGALLGRVQADVVAPLGDNQYETGAPEEWPVFNATWGPFVDRMRPAVGNHEYESSRNAIGYFAYFGLRAGAPPRGWYSYDVGSWHVVVLNSNCDVVGCGHRSAQLDWLRADLTAHPAPCTLAYWHHPRFSSGLTGGLGALGEFWQVLYDRGADVVLAGHDHDYERFAPQNPKGRADPAAGIRAFVVGTGGRSHTDLNHDEANSEIRNADTYGILALSLGAGGYAWQFLPEAGDTFTDAGSGACHP